MGWLNLTAPLHDHSGHHLAFAHYPPFTLTTAHCLFPSLSFLLTRAFFPPPLQNLDSSEISLTDVSHYFDSDPTKLVASLRTDGRAPAAFIADTTTANAQVHSSRGVMLSKLLPCTAPCLLPPSLLPLTSCSSVLLLPCQCTLSPLLIVASLPHTALPLLHHRSAHWARLCA